MYESIVEFFLTHPRRMVATGRALVTGATALVGAGLWGQAATTSVAAIYKIGGAESSPGSLAELYPSIPTWWIPESLFGYFVAGVVGAAGFVLWKAGKKYERFFRY